MRLNLIIDGNWLLMSRMFSMQDYFSTLSSEDEKMQGQQMLLEQMLKSINLIVNQFPCIDNMILVSDGGSWRKQIPLPDFLESGYKENRKKDESYDWGCIFKTLENLVELFQRNQITAVKEYGVEGDDWVANFSRRLMEKGEGVMIWSTDRDLTQLVDSTDNGFICWYNAKAGLVLDKKCQSDEITDFTMMAINPGKQLILDQLTNSIENVEYINPTDVVIEKIVTGDKSDNIFAIARKVSTKTYSVTEREFAPIKEDLHIETVENLLDKKEEIADRICEMKKYKGFVDKAQILEMVDFNRQLVELNPDLMPQELKIQMDNTEIIKYDLDYFRSNYEVLWGVQPDVKEIIENDFPF